MKRSEFFRGSAAALGLLAMPRPAPAGSVSRILRDAQAEGGETAFWKAVRGQFLLDPDWAYLNFGGLGAMPRPVFDSYQEFSRREERMPSAGHDEEQWREVKTKLARLLSPDCRREDLALIGCATEGINLVLNGLGLKPGDEVITTIREHIALKCPLLHRIKTGGLVVRTFDPNPGGGRGIVDRLAGLINARTRLIFLSHVTCTEGQRLPAREISALAREKGVLFALDGAQAPGCIPFDIVADGADFYTSSAHKWLMGPKRTGFLYVRPGMLELLSPTVLGAGSPQAQNLETGEFSLDPTAARYEYGTQNDALFFALGRALDFIEEIGLDRILAYSRGLAEAFYSGLEALPGMEILSPAETACRSCMITFRVPGRDLFEVNRILRDARIRVRPVTENDLGSIRASFSICNSREDVDRLLDVLRTLI